MDAPRDDAVWDSDDGTEAFASFLQVLELMAQLELVIAVHQHDRRALELWAAREHEAIERERQLLRQETRGSWMRRVRRRRPPASRIIEIDDDLSSQRDDAMGVAPGDLDT